MNKNEHLGIGFVTILLTGLMLSKTVTGFSGLYILAHIGLGLLGSILPDIFEPASSWRHRGFFHSYSLLGILVLVVFFLYIIIRNTSNVLIAILLGLFFGYISHLLADATTQTGLPVR